MLWTPVRTDTFIEQIYPVLGTVLGAGYKAEQNAASALTSGETDTYRAGVSL